MPTARAFCARRTIASSTSLGAVIIRSASSSMMITMSGIGSSFRSGSSGCCARTRATASGSWIAALYCSALRTWPKLESVWKRSSISATAHLRALAAFFGSVMIGVARCGRFS